MIRKETSMKGKRILAAFLCFLMLFTSVPVLAEDASGPAAVTEKTAASASAAALEITPSQNIPIGSTVTLKGKAAVTGEPDAVFRYIYYDGTTWREIYRSANPEIQVQWTPDAVGDYLVAYQVQYNGQETNAFQTLHVDQAYLRLNGIDTNPASGGGIEIRPRYETNMQDVSFTYMLYDLSDQIWYTLQDNGGTSCVWTPSKGGDYWIHVVAEDGSGREITSTMGYRVAGADIAGFSIEGGGQQIWSSTVKLTGSVNNPLGQPLTYEYLAYDGRYWKSILKTDTLQSADYRADGPGSYLLCFQIYDGEGTILKQSFLSYIAEEPAITLGSIQTSAEGEKEIHVNISGSTNGSGLEYRWMYYDLDKQAWGLIQDWSASSEAVWNPERFATYWIHVEARTEDGGSSQATIAYQVNPYHVNLTDLQVYTPDYATYYIQQNVESNDPNLQYLYQIYDLQTKQWSNIGTGHNTYWQPKASGTYWIHVVITGSNGKTYEKTIGYLIKGYRISSFGFSSSLQVGYQASLSVSGTDILHEDYTFTYLQWNGSGWDTLYTGSTPKAISWVPWAVGDYEFCCRITNAQGTVVDQVNKHIYPSDFGKNGWYYENGYKFYYINNVKQLDLDGILPKQSSYLAKINRTTCTVTIYAKDGNNGYIIPVKRFACSVGLPGKETPTGTFHTLAKYRWHELIGPSYGQYCTRIVGGVLFHSVAGSNMTSYNLDPNQYNLLGSPASSGCVRLCVRDAKWIYDNCPLGMQVDIYDSPDPGPLGQGPIIRITDPNQNWDPTDPNV